MGRGGAGGGGHGRRRSGSDLLLAPEEELRNESCLSDDHHALPADFGGVRGGVGGYVELGPSRALPIPGSPVRKGAGDAGADGGDDDGAFPAPPREALHNLRAYGAEHFQVSCRRLIRIWFDGSVSD